MAICKHKSSHNTFSAAVEYLTSQHDAKGRILRDGAGDPIPRKGCRISGIHCLPETFAPLCLRDRVRFQKTAPGAVTTHQYIVSFAPSDVAKGLTAEEAHRFALRLARENFPGHRVLVCSHPDGDNGSGNIHAHIIVSSLRFEDRPPDDRYMRLRPDGTVKPSEYLAGYAHQDTAALRKHLLAQVNSYCLSKGYMLCPEKSAVKSSGKEYLARQHGETRNDQLRRAIADAAATTDNWDAFVRKLHTAYTHTVPVIPPIPYPQRQQLWEAYKELNGQFWAWDKHLRTSLQQQLSREFQYLKACKRKAGKSEIIDSINALKGEQAKERLFRQVWQLYAKAASLALRSQNGDDAALCIEQMQALAEQMAGRWEEGWDSGSGSYALLDGAVKSKMTWKQITQSDRDIAERILHAVQEEADARKETAANTREVPMPIEVKLTRGEISFRHPDSPRWVRGKRLGAAFTLEQLEITPPVRRPSFEHNFQEILQK